MSKVEKRKSLPVDHEAVAAEEDRRETLKTSEPYQRGLALAQQTERDNRIRELESEIQNLDRMKNSGGSIVARHAGYCRAYTRLERVAKVVFELTGIPVEIPEFDPPVMLSSKTRTVSVGLPVDGGYRESKGLGKSGRGGPGIPIPGSALDWPEEAK